MPMMLMSLRSLRPLMALAFSCAVCAQSSFPGFTSGNIVVTRSVYSGDATTVSVGQPLPPVCPASADCGTAKATDNGAYASVNSNNNVFNNDAVDGSFGIASPILIDELTPTGTLISTLAVPSNMLTTSFSSKSELANQPLAGRNGSDAGWLYRNRQTPSTCRTPTRPASTIRPIRPAGATSARCCRSEANGAIASHSDERIQRQQWARCDAGQRPILPRRKR